MRLEQLERRVLGAVIFLDATTGARILSSLRVEARGVKFVRNRSGSYVIFSAPGFKSYINSFRQQPASVALESVAFEISVTDPLRRYLPRRSTIHLPLNPATTRPNEGAWLFAPIEVSLFPSPISSTLPGWAVIRATIREEGKTDRLPWSLIKVKRKGTTDLLATGLADKRGEALVAVTGLPTTTSDTGTGTVLTSEIAVTLEVIFDTHVKKVRDPEDLEALADSPEDYIPDPSALETGQPPDFRSSTTNTKLASGKEQPAELSVKLV
ncbi:MAG: hypothetical protein AUG51_18850 [Acidobacteria bacterium 13_1_20CM_3_53_8]|nr:MAG: hypothetical protein AUG51_18850 [Acidobacteria bacterium 13_1_20CM_3_53_8]